MIMSLWSKYVRKKKWTEKQPWQCSDCTGVISEQLEDGYNSELQVHNSRTQATEIRHKSSIFFSVVVIITNKVRKNVLCLYFWHFLVSMRCKPQNSEQKPGFSEKIFRNMAKSSFHSFWWSRAPGRPPELTLCAHQIWWRRSRRCCAWGGGGSFPCSDSDLHVLSACAAWLRVFFWPLFLVSLFAREQSSRSSARMTS